MKLDKKERLQFSYMLKILEKLYPEEQNYYATHRKAIEEGYELHYSWLTEHLYDGLTEKQCQEVLDILEMSRAIIFSYKAIEEPKNMSADDVAFPGFDGNNETLQMTYAQYFIEDLGRYQEIKESNGGYFNSHSRTLPRYRAMLEKWNALDKDEKFKMDEETLLNLVKTIG
ncbi:YfbU family protein [Zobellia laminariae]|uniref:YfbU family protein n=1 Tax=Zobellia laminariae TaxID=248906 RepID=UPI003EF7332E